MSLQASSEAERRGGGDAVEGRHRGAAVSTRGAIAPVAIVVASALSGGGGGGGPTENPREGVRSKGIFGPDGLDPISRVTQGDPL